MPARAPKDMDNLVKIIVSESSVLQLDGLLEKERAVADKITHELLLLASEAVHGRQSTSGAFPSSGRGNFKLLAHLVARAVGGFLNEDINSDQAIAPRRAGASRACRHCPDRRQGEGSAVA